MSFQEFQDSLRQPVPPAALTPLLRALWYDGKGDWEAAHNIAQDVHTSEGSLIHAYLHRKEGDNSNAAYWYRRAGRSIPSRMTLEEEWKVIVSGFLDQ